MSRIGRNPIEIPAGVTVKVDGALVSVTGPKGSLQREINPKGRGKFGFVLGCCDSELVIACVYVGKQRCSQCSISPVNKCENSRTIYTCNFLHDIIYSHRKQSIAALLVT